MRKGYLVKKFNSGEYGVDHAEHFAKNGYLFIMEAGGVVLDIVYVPDYVEETV